jgi:hypothetical protein
LSAAAAIGRARAAGLRLAATDAGALRLEADAEPPADVLADLRRHKAEVLALLRASGGSGAMAAGGKSIGGIGGPITPMTPMPQAPEALAPDRMLGRVSARERAEAAGPDDAPEPLPLPFRLAAWGDAADAPRPGDTCGTCSRRAPRGGRWWCEATAPKGWRCSRCHPGDHIPEAERAEVLT